MKSLRNTGAFSRGTFIIFIKTLDARVQQIDRARKQESTKTRKTVKGICNECTLVNNTNNATATQLNVNYDGTPCNPGDVLENIKYEDFVKWML